MYTVPYGMLFIFNIITAAMYAEWSFLMHSFIPVQHAPTSVTDTYAHKPVRYLLMQPTARLPRCSKL